MAPRTWNAQAKGMALAAAGMLVISPDGLFIRLAGDIPLMDMMAIRATLMGVGLTIALLIWYRRRFFGLWRNLGPYGWGAGILMAITNYFFVGGIQNTEVANVLVIMATMPFFAALFGWLLLREAVKPRTLVAITAALIGVAVLVSGSLGGGNIVGDAFAIGAASLHGLNLVALRKIGDKEITVTLVIAGFLGGAVALPFSDLAALEVHSVGWAGFQGLIQIPLALTLFIAGTRYIPAAEVALFTALETVLGPVWAWMALGEVPPVQTFIGAALVLGALVVNAIIAIRQGEPDEAI